MGVSCALAACSVGLAYVVGRELTSCCQAGMMGEDRGYSQGVEERIGTLSGREPGLRAEDDTHEARNNEKELDASRE